MNAWIALVVGIFIGWIIEWIIDWRYWRRNLAAFYTTETQLRNDLAAAQTQLADVIAANNELRAELAAAAGDDQADTAQSDPEGSADASKIDTADDVANDDSAGDDSADDDVMGDDTTDADDEVDVVPVEAASVVPVTPATDTASDDLTKIAGIGPVYRRKLHDAGVYTFGQLAAASPEQLKHAVEPQGFQTPAFDQWIADAGKLVGEADRGDAGVDGAAAGEES